MSDIRQVEMAARFEVMDRLVKKRLSEMSRAERDRRMQSNRAMAMTPQQRLAAMDLLVGAAIELRGARRVSADE